MEFLLQSMPESWIKGLEQFVENIYFAVSDGGTKGILDIVPIEFIKDSMICLYSKLAIYRSIPKQHACTV